MDMDEKKRMQVIAENIYLFTENNVASLKKSLLRKSVLLRALWPTIWN